MNKTAAAQPKVLIALNAAWNIVNFRSGLIRGLQQAGYEVVAVAPDDGYGAAVQALGCRFVPLAMDTSGTNPLRDAALMLRFVRVLRSERPAVVLAYTVKPNVYGSLAARWLGIPVINNIAGLGATFIRRGLLTRVVMALYRVALARSRVVFFQNQDDRGQFVEAGLVAPGQVRSLPGSGVDLERFRPQAVEPGAAHHVEPCATALDAPQPAGHAAGCRFLLVSRMLFDKGIGEYVEAARIVRRTQAEAVFELLGPLGVQNPAAVSRAQMDAWVAEGAVQYLGQVDDVRAHLQRADCIVLPSYREGVPRTLLEAAAMVKPIVATDAVGCRDVVDDGVNGLLCAPRDAADLARKMLRMIEMGEAARQEMGQAGRRKVESTFDERFVVAAYLEAIAEVA